MRPKRILTTALALAVAGYVVRMGLLTAFEWRREDRMRAMSDDPPLSQVLPKLLVQALIEERAFARELALFAMKFPAELARYVRAEQM